MAEQAKDNIFAYSKAQDFKFTDSELLQARIFPLLNLQFIKSELANYALRKTMAKYNPELLHPEQAYIMEQEYYRGGLEALQYIIACHEATEEALEEQMKIAAEEAQATERYHQNVINPDLVPNHNNDEV